MLSLLAIGLAACTPAPCCASPQQAVQPATAVPQAAAPPGISFDVGALDWTTSTASTVDPLLADAPIALPSTAGGRR